MWKETTEGIILPIKVIPKASKNELLSWENGELKIRIAAPPEKGCANEELIVFLSKQLEISKSRIKLISGLTSRHKRILLIDVFAESIEILSLTKKLL